MCIITIIVTINIIITIIIMLIHIINRLSASSVGSGCLLVGRVGRRSGERVHYHAPGITIKITMIAMTMMTMRLITMTMLMMRMKTHRL